MATIVLDASVLIALVDGSDVHHADAQATIHRGRTSGDRFVVPVVAYAEYMVRSFEDDAAGPDFRDTLIEAIPATVEPASRSIGRLAASLRAKHGRRMPMPDALIVGTALDIDADLVITADAGWPQMDVRVDVLNAA
jgi:predicted nucleic acid-binding protein